MSEQIRITMFSLMGDVSKFMRDAQFVFLAAFMDVSARPVVVLISNIIYFRN